MNWMPEQDKDSDTERRLTLREKLLAKLAAEGLGEEEREVTVMARMNKRVVETLDSLVSLGIFKSRSEAAAVLIEGAISSREDLFSAIREQAAALERSQDAAVKSAQDAVLERLG
jgi:Arc/MetJ-type ribon-helix-helix transcriptional regulator